MSQNWKSYILKHRLDFQIAEMEQKEVTVRMDLKSIEI